ncbi:hypothetical protein JCM8202_002398 [Rhodotorula sphaerocarpa]
MPAPFPTPQEQVDRVPLIKNPGFWVPKPVELPLDVHPLPDDIQAYFVYPYSLESHVLQTLPAALADLRRTEEQHRALLASYAESKERQRLAELNRLAPGYREGLGVMQPLRAGGSPNAAKASPTAGGAARSAGQQDLLGNADEDDAAGDGAEEAGREPIPRSDRAQGQPTPPNSEPTDQFKDFVDGLERLDSSLGGVTGSRHGEQNLI